MSEPSQEFTCIDVCSECQCEFNALDGWVVPGKPASFCSSGCVDNWMAVEEAKSRLESPHVAIGCPDCCRGWNSIKEAAYGGTHRCPTCNGGGIITVPEDHELVRNI